MAGGRKIHPLVYLDYRIRVPANLILCATLAAVLYERPTGPLVWAALAFHALVWPHLAFLNARHWSNTKRAELTNLVIDAVVDGGWIAVIGFSPWPTAMAVSALTVAFLSVAGVRFTLLALGMFGVGAVVTGLVAGFHFEPQASTATVALSFTGFILYATVFGIVTNRQARRIVQSNKTIEQQKRESARLFAELEARTQELGRSLDEVRALSEVTQAASSSLDLRDVLDTVLRHAVQLAGGDAGAVFQFDPPVQTFGAVASRDLGEEFLERVRKTPIDPTRGVIRRATDTGEPFQIPDVIEAPEFVFRDVTLREGFRAMLVVPIPGRTIMRGITVFRRAPGPFDPRRVDLVAALANQSKVAIQNARLFEEVRNHRVELERLSHKLEQLYRLSTAMQEPLSLREQLRRVLEATIGMGLLDRVYVWAVAPEADRLVNLAGAGFAADEWKDFEGTEIPLAQAGAMNKAYREGVPLVFDDDHPLPLELRLAAPYSELKAIRTRALLVVPMIARGVTVGVLAGDNKPSRRPIDPQTVALVQTFASHAAVAVANARLFQAIEDKSRQLEAATEAKSQFLASMSHELRTPLNAVIGFSEVLLERMFGDVNAKQEEYLKDILDSGRHLLSLINDILDLSKIEAGRMELQLGPMDVRETIEASLTLVRERASRRGIAVGAEVDERLTAITADERKVKQVLLNLLSNAVKFTPEDGRITVRAAAVDGAVEVSVADTGIGIAPEDLDAVFEEFRQVGVSDARRHEGTGLGLTLARKFVELHGGRIWVESQVGRGSTFTFTIPAHRPAA